MKQENKNFTKIMSILFVLLVVLAGIFVLFSPQFEKNIPKVTLKNYTYWNMKENLNLSIFDQSGIKSYTIIYKDSKSQKILESKKILTKQTSLIVEIKAPRINNIFKVDDIILSIEVTDNSKWNFLQGNTFKKEYKIKIDKQAPIANVITNSYNIKRGGSALVIVEVKDKNLNDKYISFNNKYRFELFPFSKENYYIALIAWPVDEKEFKRFNLLAIDKANNITKVKIPLYIRKLKIKKDKINISNDFINTISLNVLEQSNYEIPSTKKDIFIKANKVLREENISFIRQISLEHMSKDLINSFNIKAFRRLRASRTFASFAQRRSYFYEKEKIDEAWHLGMDWASVKKARIYISNDAKIIYNDYLGIYGNTIIADHGLGLQTLYAHLSKSDVQVNQEVKRKKKIAYTGSSGAVFGDHLHFGVLIQGIEVNPIEWMDKSWIKTRVLDIIKDAKKIMRKK